MNSLSVVRQVLEELRDWLKAGDLDAIIDRHEVDKIDQRILRGETADLLVLVEDTLENQKRWDEFMSGSVLAYWSGNYPVYENDEYLQVTRDPTGVWRLDGLPHQVAARVVRKREQQARQESSIRKGDPEVLAPAVLKQAKRLGATVTASPKRPADLTTAIWKVLPTPLRTWFTLRWPAKVTYTTGNLDEEPEDDIQFAGVDFVGGGPRKVDPARFGLRNRDGYNLLRLAFIEGDDLLLVDAADDLPQDPMVLHIFHHDPGQIPTTVGRLSEVLKALEQEHRGARR